MVAQQIELDKTWDTTVAADLGCIRLRVVVLKLKEKQASTVSDDDDDDEPVKAGASPLSAYLEKHAYGRMCIPFLFNGQRHDAWDSNFVSKDLGFKYLKNRTMIVVDLDGLAPEAIAELVTGSRQGLFEGNVLHAIRARMIATLKKDPDLVQLQTEAEQAVSELEAGDEVVKEKLDELIEAHHSGGDHVAFGNMEPEPSSEGGLFGYGKTKRQDVVSPLPPDVGKPDTEPLLATVPGVQRFRLRPAEERIIQVKTVPESETHLEDVLIDVEPKIAGLEKEEEQTANGVRVRLLFTEPEDFDVDEYPLESTLSVLAKLKGHDKLRLLERDIVVNPRPGPRPPKPPPTLYDTPSVLKVISRQPIKLIPGTLSAHVKMRWDGEDYLTGGVRPKWRITARCLSIASFPAISSSRPRQGRFELLLDTPHGLIPKQELEFEVVASGPERKEIKATFRAVVADVEPPLEARAIRVKAPEHGASRRPPYKLKYVKQPDWSSETCWGGTQWSEYDAGAFQEPTASDPLILMINQDMDALRELREDLVKRKIAESSIKQRMTHYSTHIGFHLYQMYHAKKDRDRQAELSDDARAPQDTEFRDEIRRVAMTLLKLMVGIRG